MSRVAGAIRRAIKSPREFGRALRYRNGPPRLRNLDRLIAERKPQTIVEIGVWRGQTARRMIRAAVKQRRDVSYWGFDLFEGLSDEILSRDACLTAFVAATPAKLSTVAEIAHDLEGLGATVTLVPGDSTKTVPSTELPPIEFAFIDGGHTYETVAADWSNIKPKLAAGAVVVFDDYTNEEAVKGEDFGVTTLIEELRADHRVELLDPIDEFPRPYGKLETRLALIRL
jgi:predicted O-methyltransferase YrrM